MNESAIDMSRPNTHCARCNAPFRCGSIAGDARCHCDDLTLNTETLAYLRERYTGCLCHHCLQQFAAAGPEADAPKRAP